MEEEAEYQPGAEEIIPVDEGALMFYGKPLIVVTLPDGRPAVSIRSLCENMELDRKAQVRRIRRTAPIAGDLVANVRIHTGGGGQAVQVLVLRSLAYWLTGIDHKRTRPVMQAEILKYQCEAVDALYTWAAQRPRALPASAEAQLIEAPDTAIARPGGGAVIVPMEEPGAAATHHEKAVYHEMMSVWHRHQADQHAQAWRTETQDRITEVQDRIQEQEARLEAREAVTDLIPEILDRLGPETISVEQQRQLQAYVRKLHELTGKPYGTIYDELKTVFERPRYQEIRADEWPQVKHWFESQIERAKQGR